MTIPTDFDYTPNPTLTRLEGEWVPVSINRDGQNLPQMILLFCKRVAKDNEVRITFAGQVIIHALVRVIENTDPIQLDYYRLDGSCKGSVQFGIMKWIGEDVCFCMAGSGAPRPTEFECPNAIGSTLSVWRLKS